MEDNGNESTMVSERVDPSLNMTLVCAQQGHKAHAVVDTVPAGLVYRKKLESRKKCTGWRLQVIGFCLMMMSLFLYLLNPAERINQVVFKFSQGSFLFKKWVNPPIKVNLNFHIFNYTNSEAFMRGEEELRVEDIGPYSFEEISVLDNITFNNNHTLTYIPRRAFKEDPDVTVGSLDDVIVVPNFVYLGLATYLADSSFFTNTAFNVIAKMLQSEPFITLTVGEYLRGKEEPLLSNARVILPDMVPMDRLSFLDAIVNDGENVVTMNLNAERVRRQEGGDMDMQRTEDGGEMNMQWIEPFSVNRYNGRTGLEQWGYKEYDNSTHRICNTLSGVATEGGLVPRRLNKDLRINYYRKMFCRTLPIVFDHEGVTSKGLPAYWLKFREDAFHNSNPENSCFCLTETCLPDGLTDISPCLFDMPWALSTPHFLYGDPSLVKPWKGGLSPNIQEHGTWGILDKTFAVIIQAKLRIQLNLVMGHTRFSGVVKPFNGKVLPAMWAEYHFNELPSSLHALLHFCVVVLPVLGHVIFALLAVAGFALLLRGFFRPPRVKAVYRRLVLYTRPTRTAEGVAP